MYGEEFYFGGLGGIEACSPVSLCQSSNKSQLIKCSHELKFNSRKSTNFVNLFYYKYVTFCSCNNNHFNFFKGGTFLGQPDSIVDLGHTQIPHDIFLGHLHDLAQSTFKLIAIKS